MKSNPISGTIDKAVPKIKTNVKYHAPKKTSDKPYAMKDGQGNKAPDLSKLLGWRDFSKAASQRKHWEWFVIDQFLRGNHSVKGDSNNNSIILSRKGDRVDYPLNKIFSTFRAVRGYVTRHKPKVTVEPENSGDEKSVDYARKSNKLLDRDNQLNNFRKINKEWVYYGVKYGEGYRQIGYDTVNKRSIRWTIDPFDLGIGSKVGEFEDAPYLVKSVVRTVGYLRNKFPKEAASIVPDNQLAFDEFKRMALELQYPNTTPKDTLDDSEETAIVHECWYRMFEPNSKGGLVNKCTFTETATLDHEETPYKDYPFIVYKSDITPNEVHAEGHLKHVIAPQRMLNLLNTQVLEYNHLTNRGRYMMDKNSGFKLITTKEGQIILKNPGKQVISLPIPSLNQLIQWQIQFASEQIEDLGGQHQASLGATPPRISTGNAIEALQSGDSNNISDLRDNFEDALAAEAAWILRVYSLFESDGVTVNYADEEGTDKSFRAYGSQAVKESGRDVPSKYFTEESDDYVDAYAVLPENQVKVTVTSELGESRQARLQLLMDLVDRGMPLKFLLENIEFPNAGDVFERIASESVADMMMQKMAEPPQVGPDGQPMPQGPPGAIPPDGAPPPGEGAPPDDILAQLETLAQNTGGQ